MHATRSIMGMPITVEITDTAAASKNLEEVFKYFRYVDQKFSTYKKDSEISRINALPAQAGKKLSKDMEDVLERCEETKLATNGYFNIDHNGKLDPSGLVKGWAILNAAQLIKNMGFKTYYVEAGGDIQVGGKSWKVGIRNPFNVKEIVKVVSLNEVGIATSGTYLRGQHIYNPFKPGEKITEIVSLSVIGPNVYEADRFATAAFAMGKEGINFIEGLSGFEGYQINARGMAIYTSGFEKYVT